MTRVLLVGGGVAGLLTTQLLLDRADDLTAAHGSGATSLEVTLLVHRPGERTASRSGGLALRYASTDPRSDRWTARSSVLAQALAARHDHLRPHVRSRRALVVSRRGPVAGYPGDVVDPVALGLSAHSHAVAHEASPQWDPCALLPTWPAVLAEDPRVQVRELPDRVTSLADLGSLHDDHHADVTVACLGLGAHALGDRCLGGRLGVLVSGPLPVGTVHAERAVVDDDDPDYPRYTVPHGDHLHLGGTYLPVDDPADWDCPERLAERARAEVPGILAAASDHFPALAGWRPTGGPWWGIRPVRGTVALGRVDPTLVAGRDVVVTHGWGGSGWTIGPAVAEEVARAVLPGPDTGAEDPLVPYGPWRP